MPFTSLCGELNLPKQGPTMYFINDLISNSIKWQKQKQGIFLLIRWVKISIRPGHRIVVASGGEEWLESYEDGFLGVLGSLLFLDLDAGFFKYVYFLKIH